MITIYALRDPRTMVPRYVGITTITARRRLIQHACDARTQERPKYPVHRWLRKLFSAGLEPLLDVLELTEDRDREIWWIAKYRAEHPGALLNIMAGGSAPPSTDPAVRERMRGPKSAAHCAAISRTKRARFAAGLTKGLSGDDNPMRKHPEKVLRGSKNGSAKLTEIDVILMRAEYADGATTTALASKFSVTQGCAWRIVNGLSWRHAGGFVPAPRGRGKRPATSTRRGADSPQAKLTPEAVLQIRRLHADGGGCAELSRQFGVSDTNILRIVRGQAWKHLPLAA